jgi:hypothetical protein
MKNSKDDHIRKARQASLPRSAEEEMAAISLAIESTIKRRVGRPKGRKTDFRKKIMNDLFIMNC